jgi:MFS superfamily sulfate permease-like transporter
MPNAGLLRFVSIPRDVTAGIAVFLVALPLCLGIAHASGAPLSAGLLSGILGGLVVGALSGSHKSVTGPSAGLTATVAAQTAALGSFEAFLLAAVLAGVMQVALGVLRFGFIAAFFPFSVIKGLLAAIGLLLVLKQIPHVLGHDTDYEGEMSFFQPDSQNTFSELVAMLSDIQPGAALVGLGSLLLLALWNRSTESKKSPLSSALVVVVFGVAVNLLLRQTGSPWIIQPEHLVQVPVATDFTALLDFFRHPDLSQWAHPGLIPAALTIAVVATLETLLNLEAIDKIDPDQRRSPPNRELIAQGVGNITAGLLGGLPMTTLVARSSVGIHAGGKTRLATIVHGSLLLVLVAIAPGWLNEIPLAALAAILLTTGVKLANPALFQQMWSEGQRQFLPFIATIVAIVFTDLLTGMLVGLAIAILFILHSNLRRPLKRVVEKHASGDVLRIELANQVSFLNRASLAKTLFEVPRGGHVLLDATETDYIDPDIRDLISDFCDTAAKAHGVEVSLVGFQDHYQFRDRIRYIDYSSREVQSGLTPQGVLDILREGNRRFLAGERIERDYSRQVHSTSTGQFPMAVVLSCIDSRAPAETVLDLGLGDIFSARIAGNIVQDGLLGSMEYACVVAGSKLIVVMGHTACGAVHAAVGLMAAGRNASEATGCGNLDGLVVEIQKSIDPGTCKKDEDWAPGEKAAYSNDVSRRNVLRTIREIRRRSTALDKLVKEGRIAIVGGLYDVGSGEVRFFQTPDSSVTPLDVPMAEG